MKEIAQTPFSKLSLRQNVTKSCSEPNFVADSTYEAGFARQRALVRLLAAIVRRSCLALRSEASSRREARQILSQSAE